MTDNTMAKQIKTNNGRQNITQTTKDWATRTHMFTLNLKYI